MLRSLTCRGSCTASWPIRRRPARPRQHSPRCCRDCSGRWKTGARDGSWRGWCPASSAVRPVGPGGRTGAARAGGWRPAPGGVRLHPGAAEDRAGQPGSRAARSDRGTGARTGRPPRRLGTGRRRSRAVCSTLINAELDKMSPDGSELRAAFDEWVRREINRHGKRSGSGRPSLGRPSASGRRTKRCRPGYGTSGRGCGWRWRRISRGRTAAWWLTWRARWGTWAQS